MFGGTERCQYCDDYPGSGKCAGCYGTGKNLHLNSESPVCEECKGTGLCRRCGGRPSLGPPWSRRMRDRILIILSHIFNRGADDGSDA